MSCASKSLNLNTRFIIFFSPFSRTPVSEPAAINDLMSSSVYDCFGFSIEMPRILRTRRLTSVKRKTTGRSIFTTMSTKSESAYAIPSGLRVERVFGVISPKTRSKIVTTNVAIPTPRSPKSASAAAVRIDDSRIFTRSFATSSVFISISFFSRSFPARNARLSFFPRSTRRRSLFIARKELSEMENNIESTIRTADTTSSPASGTVPTCVLTLLNRHPYLQPALLLRCLPQNNQAHQLLLKLSSVLQNQESA